MAVYNISGNATITDIISGIYQGSGDITTAKRIQGGSFGANITIKAVPTNTNVTRHSGSYSDTSLEFTNTGLVEFADGASGDITGTKGPSSTIEKPAYHGTQNIWEDSSTAGRFLLLRFGDATVAGGVGSTAYSGIRVNNNNPYYTTSGRTWEARKNGDVFYERGVNESGDNYAIIKHTCTVVRVRAGGTTLTIATDNGTNFADNILRTEDPFTVSIIPPADTYYKVKYGTTTSAVQSGTLSLDESNVDRGDTIKLAAVRDGFALVYQTYIVEQIAQGGTQTINIPATTPEPVPIDNTGDVSLTSYSFDTTNNWVIAEFNKIPQTDNGNLIMNKFMTTLMKNATNAGNTIDAILYHEDASWYRSGGVGSGQFIDPKKVKITSTDGADADTAQIYPNYIILGTSTNIQELTDQDDFLTALPFAVGVTTTAVASDLLPMFKRTSRLKPVNNITDE